MVVFTRKIKKSAGFTLLEILLALALSVVLLVAVGTAIDLYRRMTYAGQNEVSEARVVRAILRKIETDVRSIVPPQSQVVSPSDTSSGSTGGTTASGTTGTSGTSGSSSGTSSTSSSSTSTGTTTATTQQSAMGDPLQNIYAQTIFGLYGNQQTLVLNTMVARRQSAAPAASGTGPVVSTSHGDLKTVAYFFAGGGAAPVGGQTAAGAATSGLARLEGEHAAIGYAMQQSASLASGARIIAPEVMSLAFRYFDGTQWLATWDAQYLQLLPQAVECTITIRQPDAAGTGQPASNAQPHVYRHVIPITTMQQPVPISQLATIPAGTQ
jgi:prepilin-type N-terminal cleavage/methylation domain-containing protein